MVIEDSHNVKWKMYKSTQDTFSNDVAAGYAIWVAAVVYVGKEK